MDTIKLHANALLAEASYARFDEPVSMKDALIDYSFSQLQAEEFILNWEIISQTLGQTLGDRLKFPA